MEQVTITTAVNVKGGPLVKVSARVDSDAYVVASLALAKTATGDVSVLPTTGAASLLVIQARNDLDQSPAKVEVTPEGSAVGTKLVVAGSLLVANTDVLAALAAGGPRKLTVKNVGTQDVTVSILAAFDS
ncbi:hypothetical protein [Cellulomonas sp. URHE0023]|uniref:hypothetical protein n=1 Tax=Cellulomonas sp. URHE0023 TaxID=1380354 RepID=UPI00048037E9|nr:hypothetical protein [Cellulomonas sp. URHE0023]